jgi:transcriptional regulator PpsR
MMAHAAAAHPLHYAQPDVTLVLDLEGVIREATLSEAVPSQDLESWIGRPWIETVVDPGSAKVQRIVEDARSVGVSAFRQVNQRFPSGLELPIEYTAVRLGRQGLMAVGKSLQAVAELQSRLIAAQQAIERDYFKLREVETRCRLLFDRSNEAVLLVRAANLRILEANPAANRALGRTDRAIATVSGRELMAEIAPEERGTLEAMLRRVRDQGKAPGILLRLGRARDPWLVRASLLPSQEGLAYLVQLTPAGPIPRDDGDRLPVESLVERSPDGFVALDAEGRILRANRAFLELAQLGDETSVIGERLSRWLGRPGADLAALLANVATHGSVRLFSTTLQGELGSTTEIEISAVGENEGELRTIGVWIRDVASRLPAAGEANPLGSTLGRLAARIGKTPLPALAKEAVGAVERHCIEAALALTSGNRTAAAQILGLSRQGLYAKLNRYGLEGETPPSSPRTD